MLCSLRIHTDPQIAAQDLVNHVVEDLRTTDCVTVIIIVPQRRTGEWTHLIAEPAVHRFSDEESSAPPSPVSLGLVSTEEDDDELAVGEDADEAAQGEAGDDKAPENDDGVAGDDELSDDEEDEYDYDEDEDEEELEQPPPVEFHRR